MKTFKNNNQTSKNPTTNFQKLSKAIVNLRKILHPTFKNQAKNCTLIDFFNLYSGAFLFAL